jgi:hypothetical protein
MNPICESLAEFDADDAADENGIIQWRIIPAGAIPKIAL